ncbi:hypothetical protein TR631_12495 [Streptomyces rochei]|uniref:hypothetical protein n=1 Tax=Streptomyces rochei TaxID=1928 RepID=UPI002ACD5082|nr:hypothetical protein [Streptomyces rochei]WQC12587.1 hypothetical protein TR631_12495 [Streptomyces rochei]
MPSSTTATTEPTNREWHWVMTVQTAKGVLNTRTATLTAPNDYTRAQLWSYIFDQFKADYDGPLTVLFFDLQPNKL